jgi:Condensation domain
VSTTHAPPGQSVMLTATQEGMWFAERLNPGRSGYHDAVTLALAGPLDPDGLQAAIADCRLQHDALRLRVCEAGGKLTQSFDAAAPRWHHDDLRALTADRQRANVRRRFALDCTEPFDLAAGPLWRLRLVRLADEEHKLLIVMHHLMTDGWSHGVFLRSLISRYATRLADPAARPLPAPSFRLWASRRIAAENALATADRALEAARQLRSAPRRVELPGLIAASETRGSVLALELTQGDLASFDAACATAGLSRYMAMTGLFAHLIGDLASTPELVISAPVADRVTPDAARILGCMINVVPMRVMARAAGLAEAARAGRQAVVSALELLDVPYRDIVRGAEAPFGFSLADPLTNVSCEEFNSPRGTWQVGELTVTIHPRGEFQVRHDLTLSVPRTSADPPELIYPAARWNPGAIAGLGSRLAGLVRAFGRGAT